MKKKVFVLAAIFAAVSLIAINIADAQWRSETHDVYNAPTGIDVIIDGNLDEWAGVMDSVTGTDGSTFCGVEFENLGAFQEHGGGTWSGPDDHTTCFMIVWDADAVYLALDVTDDEFEHGGGNPWEGDGAQLSFTLGGERATQQPQFLYNGALNNSAENIITQNMNERTHNNPGLVAGEDVAIIRDEDAKKTYYEFKFVPANFGLDITLSEGLEFGLSICVNDGDKASGQGGQKGWSGWYPHAIVHGKNSEKSGLVVLNSNAVTAVEPANKLTTTWGTIKSVR